jgi:haloalkane dehalogenase
MTPRPPVEENAMIGTKPYAKLKYREVKGRQMAYIDEGEGDAIVFQHGQPTSSCVWRPRHASPGRKVPADRQLPDI